MRELAGLARETPPQLELVDRALPPLTALATTLRPALRLAPGVLDGVDSMLAQVEAASRPAEIPRLLDLAEPAARALPSLTGRLRTLFGQVTPVSECVRDRIAPVLHAKLDDGRHSTGMPVWQDLVHGVAGTAGTSGFDANGPWMRMSGLFNEGSIAVGSTSSAELVGLVGEPLLGTRPAPPDQATPLRPDADCRAQKPPDLRAETGPPPPQGPAKGARR